jgi:hypothetical protein
VDDRCCDLCLGVDVCGGAELETETEIAGWRDVGRIGSRQDKTRQDKEKTRQDKTVFLREKPNTDRPRAKTGKCHRQTASGKVGRDRRRQRQRDRRESCSLSKEESKTGPAADVMLMA